MKVFAGCVLASLISVTLVLFINHELNHKSDLSYPSRLSKPHKNKLLEDYWGEKEPEYVKSWKSGNIVQNAAFSFGKDGEPEEWGFFVPNKYIGPKFSWVETPNKKMSVLAEGIG